MKEEEETEQIHKVKVVQWNVEVQDQVSNKSGSITKPNRKQSVKAWKVWDNRLSEVSPLQDDSNQSQNRVTSSPPPSPGAQDETLDSPKEQRPISPTSEVDQLEIRAPAELERRKTIAASKEWNKKLDAVPPLGELIPPPPPTETEIEKQVLQQTAPETISTTVVESEKPKPQALFKNIKRTLSKIDGTMAGIHNIKDSIHGTM
jgi:hypothetical protein